MPKAFHKTFRSTRDILERAASVHRRMGRNCRERMGTVEDPRARMLLEDVDHRERQIERLLSRYRQEAPQRVLDTHYQFTPHQEKSLEAFLDWEPEPGQDATEVLSGVLRFDARMKACYGLAARMAPSAAVREIFENLAAAIEVKRQEEAKDAGLMEDL